MSIDKPFVTYLNASESNMDVKSLPYMSLLFPTKTNISETPFTLFSFP